MEIYLVGGAVRDRLLGLSVKERDWVVVGATPAQMLAAGYQQVGKDFPVFLHPQTHEEYALARTERKTAPGYTGFICHAEPDVTLEEDLKRRDLTINAIAESSNGELIDPFKGQQDLQDRWLRHVSEAFNEDPVRILRLARFASRFSCLGFRTAPETQSLMQEMVASGEVDALVPERVWKELSRALGEAEPWQFFLVLENCGAAQRLCPELQPHLPAALDALKKACAADLSPVQRFAALLSVIPDAKAVQNFCKRLRSPKEYQQLAQKLQQWQPALSQPLNAETALEILESLNSFRTGGSLEEFCQTQQALSGNSALSEQLQQACTAASAIAIAAQDLIAQGHSGKALGDAIRQARLDAIKNTINN